MSVQGLCEICQSAQAAERCERCGTIVCEQHLDRELGYCADCAAETRGGGQGTGDTFQF